MPTIRYGPRRSGGIGSSFSPTAPFHVNLPAGRESRFGGRSGGSDVSTTARIPASHRPESCTPVPMHGLLNPLTNPPGMTSRRLPWTTCATAGPAGQGGTRRHARSARFRRAGRLRRRCHPADRVCPADAQALRGHVPARPESPTEDVDGEVTELVDPPVPSLDQIARGRRSR